MRPIRIAVGLLSAICAAVPASAPWAADGLSLTVTVANVRSAEGTVHIALWSGPDGFLRSRAALAVAELPAAAGRIEHVFTGLAPGAYALVSYHDENDNDRFDRTWLGLPDEGLGFSNDARLLLLGPPSFEAAAIEVGPGRESTVISLTY